MSVGLGDAAARGTGATLATQALRAVLQFASIVLLARLLAPEDFGLIAMVAAVIGVADLLRDFGLSSAAVQAKDVTDAERTGLFWVNLALGAGCAAVATACTPLVVQLYDEPRLAPVVPALAVVFVLSGATTQFRADLTRSLRFGALARADIASQLAGILTGVGLALSGAGLWALVAQQVAAALVALVMGAWSSHWRPGRPARVPLGRFFRFGGGLLGTQLIHYLTKNVDNVALGATAGPVTLGLYSRAYQLLMTPLNTINAPMTRVALPVLSRVQEDDETLLRYLARAQLVACYLTAGVFAVAAGLADPLVHVLFGPQWSEVAPLFAVLAVGGVFRSVAQIAYWLYLARGLTGAQLRQYLVTGPLLVGAILAGLPWGAMGVAVSHTLGHAVAWVISLVHAGRAARLDTRPLLRNGARAMLLVALPCGLLARAGAAVPVPPLGQLAVGLALAGGYVLAAHVLLPPVRRDTTTVLDFARRAVRRA